MTSSDTAIPVGARIVRAREHQGWSREELARRMGVTLETISAWEEGERDPRANRLFTLAGILNVTPNWLLEGDVEAFETAGNVDPVEAMRSKLGTARLKLQEANDLVNELERQLDEL
ncbi:helix-turn-helix transcriptional regulator [Marivibrio halodurans]|uniref:Helix-turn-helix transcriptional regulator n=1 Tax=Marivibrio halodurans TaxID=2039722 RepID=A0A8J7V2F9_9PROT|nr:helix-turn-helix transcriptional regulator [Marivibrio halodurans]MBP5855724.1 helix-turn-helix transcriptional regulator [Marivibrio halodurans]